MSFGYNGKVLQIDLTDKQVESIKLDDKFYRRYIGGACLAAYFLLKNLKPKTDPLSPDNILIFSTSPITGVDCAGTAMHNVITKSPLTNLIGEATTPGYLGEMIKKSGFDAIIIKGKSEKPCMIVINDGEVKFLEANHIWGLKTSEAYNILTQQEDLNRHSIALIGPAGEKLVRFASIITDNCFISSRCGVGAVMGSKNLKALCVYGQKPIKVSNPEKLGQVSKYFEQNFLTNPLNESQHGPASNAGYLKLLSDQGMLSAKNFHYSYFDKAESIDGFTIADKYAPENHNCSHCQGGCKKRLPSVKDINLNPEFGLIELESLAATSYNLLVDDMEATLKLWNMICDYGVDGTSLGNILGYAVECYENGLISPDDTMGTCLRWGDSQAMLKMATMIMERKSIGDTLAEGVRLASYHIQGSEKFAMHIKGMEMPFHEPRIKQMLGLGYAVSPIGPYYTVVEHDTDFDFQANQMFMDKVAPLTVYDRLPAYSLNQDKVRMFFLLQPAFSMLDALCGCIFAFSPVRFFNFQYLVDIIDAVTGWETSLFELVKIGEKRINIYKLFALREEVGEDILPDRIFEPIENGPNQGMHLDKKQFMEAKQLYYQLAGWDTGGKPTDHKLLELELTEFKNK